MIEVEEKELTQWIILCTISGHVSISHVVREMVEGIRKGCIEGINEAGMELVYYEPIRKG